MQKRTFIALAIFTVLLVTRYNWASAADICDRACLESHVNRYITAMIAHNPNQLPLARDVRFTENGQELRLDDGLWAAASGQTFPAPFQAPLTFQIPELFQIRNGKIDQIEAVLNTVPYRMRSDAWDR